MGRKGGEKGKGMGEDGKWVTSLCWEERYWVERERNESDGKKEKGKGKGMFDDGKSVEM